MKFLAIISILFCATMVSAQKKNVGVFTNSEDIGKPKNTGSSTYDTNTQTYTLKGAGYNIWFNRDEFHYLYKKISGDFVLTANFKFAAGKGNSHRKIGGW